MKGEIIEYYSGSELMFIDDVDLDIAIVGVGSRFGITEPIIVYDKDMILEVYMTRDGMEYEEALEYFEYNVIGRWLGELTPMFIERKFN